MAALSSLRLDVDASPVYELLLQVSTFASGDSLGTFDVGQRWRTTQEARCTPRMSRAFARLNKRCTMWDQLIAVQVAERTSGVPQFLELVAAMDPVELHRHLSGFYTESLTATECATLEQEFAQSGMVALRKELVLDALRGWYERIFARDEAAVTAVLEDDARARRMLSTTDPGRLILLTTGVRYIPMPAITRVVLIPALILRPWLGAVISKGMQIYCYPVLEDPNGIEAPVPALLPRLYGALAMPGCLRILKTLGTEQLTAPEIAERLGDKPHLVRANLARLRVSGLVQMTCNGAGVSVYERRTELLRAVGQPLKSFLRLPAVPVETDRGSGAAYPSMATEAERDTGEP